MEIPIHGFEMFDTARKVFKMLLTATELNPSDCAVLIGMIRR